MDSTSRARATSPNRPSDVPALERAPSTPIVDGEPAFGTYRGSLERTSLDVPRDRVGRLRSILREKHRQWFAVADERTAVGGAIVDAGPVGTVFCWVADRHSGTLVDASRLLPGPLVRLSNHPTSGRIATGGLLGGALTVERSGSTLDVRGGVGDLELDLEFDASAADAVTAICPVAGGPRAALNVTQKELLGRATGTVAVAGRRRSLSDGVGLLDHTHGLLARETRWRWAMGVGTVDDDLVGFNLVSGFNDGLENVVWIDGEPRAVGSATVEDPDPPNGPRWSETGDERTWRGVAEDGTVDVGLEADGERTENTTVGPFASQYRQPFGSWSGRVDDRDLEECFGVAEIHRARW